MILRRQVPEYQLEIDLEIERAARSVITLTRIKI